MSAWPLAFALWVGAPELPRDGDFDRWMAVPPAPAPGSQTPAWDVHRRSPTILRGAGAPPPSWVSGPESAAWWFLEQRADAWGLGEEGLRSLRVSELHDLGVGAIVVSFQALVDGTPVFRDELNVALDQQLRLLGITGHMSGDVGRAPAGTFGIGSTSALAVALGDAGGSPWAGLRVLEHEGPWLVFDGPELGQPTRVRPVLYPHPSGLRRAFHVEVVLDGQGRNEARAYVVDGSDGEILFRRSLIDDAFSYRVYADASDHPADGPNGNDEIPDRSGTTASPPRSFETPILVTLPHSGISTGDPWLAPGATETAGNNVDAYTDLEAPDGLTAGSNDRRATTTSADTFDYVYDTNSNASANDNQRSASTVHAFYTTNFLHDDFYDVGFDEVAGNAQKNNFGRGGLENDDMRVELHDYSGRNNANMATPADGGRPRMQMYLWNEIDRVSVRGVSPSAIATDFVARSASFAPQDFEVTAELVPFTAPAGGLADACSPPFAEDVTGKIALIEGGACSAVDQVANLAAAGASGVIVAASSGGPSSLSGGSSQSIGVVSIGAADAGRLASAASAIVQIQRDEGEEVDSGLDTLVLAHEWGHYISNRLVGNASGLFGNQARGMGEGWSDFHGLLTTVQADDVLIPGNSSWEAAFAASNTVAFRGPYFGIRRVPYSTDFDKNAFTYRHIQLNEPLPSGVPTAFGRSGASNNRVHRTGEVWATMLWEFYAALLNDPRHDFEEARTRMKSYLVAGYKLTPVAPTIREARDALLLAALGRDPQDFEQMYEAFARRGVGATATGPSRFSTTNRPVDESFALEGALLGPQAPGDEAFWCDREGVLDAGETGRLTVQVSNDGMSELMQPTLVVSSSVAGISFPDGARFSLAPIPSFGTATATINVALEGLTDITLARVDLELQDPVLTATGSAGGASMVSFRANYDEVPNSAVFDDVEASASAWSVTRSRPDAAGFARRQVSPLQHRWRANNDSFGAPTNVYLTSPPIDVASADDFVVSFEHRYDIEEGWDGGAIEISADGVTWDDVSAYADPGYDAPLNDRTASPLNQTPAYNGRSREWPELEVVSLDFGRSFAGQTVQIRFWLSSDQFVTGEGWDIDDIALAGVTNRPFTSLVPDRGLCVNRPPVAHPAPDQVVFEGEGVELVSDSSDPDGDPLTVEWRQVGGPAVALDEQGRFTAPAVTEDTLLSFEFEVDDGDFKGGPAPARVLVRQRNQPPTVAVSGVTEGQEGEMATVTATGADPERSPISFVWRQLSGPPLSGLSMRSENGAIALVLPEVRTTEPILLEVQSDDGQLRSAPARHEIVVQNVNEAPEALSILDVDAVEQRWVSLEARAIDPDGDPLSFVFEALDDAPIGVAAGPRYRIFAPEVDEVPRTLRYAVTVSDGEFVSDPVEVEVTVREAPRPPLPPAPDIDHLFPQPESGMASDDEGGLAESGGCSSLPADGAGLLWLLSGGWLYRRRRRARAT